MTTYFTSDLHIQHANIIKYCNRPYETVDEMNEALINNWNNIVLQDDTVYILGDFSLSEKAVEKTLFRLIGKKILIMGNHDKPHPVFKKKHIEAVDRYKSYGFEEIYLTHMIDNVLLSHFPYLSDDSDLRYPKWRLIDEGKFLLCGHVHDKWKIKGLMINVGVDVRDYHPVSWETLQLEMEEIIRGENT